MEALYQVYGLKEDIETADIVLALKQQVPLSRTMREAIQNRRLWAATRTVNASAERQLADVAVAPDALDEQKEALYLQFVALQRRLPAEVRMLIEQFLGPFPGKHEEFEKMRLYLTDYKRLASKLLQSKT
jgi:hypothetical protein